MGLLLSDLLVELQAKLVKLRLDLANELECNDLLLKVLLKVLL